MPFKIIDRDDGKFDVINSDTKEVKNDKPLTSRARAEAYMRALYANLPSGEKAGRRIKEDMAAVLRDVEAGIAKLRQWADYEDGETPEDEQAESESEPVGESMDTLGAQDAETAQETIEQNVGAKAISKREDVSEADKERAKGEYGDVKFADEKNKKYPIDTEAHIRSAWSYFNMPDNAAKYSDEEVKAIKTKIVAAWKDKIDKEGPPAAQKGLNFSYAKSLGLSVVTDDILAERLAVKSIGADEIRGYMMLWGNPAVTDIEQEFFTPLTDFWDKSLGKSQRPLTWDHAQDPLFKSDPHIGDIVDFGDDEVGRWFVARLDRNHRYRKAVDAMIASKAVGASSDTAPQYAIREPRGKAAWLKQWPFFAGALTDCPCEPRMFQDGSVEFLKSIGVNLPEMPDLSGMAIQAARLKIIKAKLSGG